MEIRPILSALVRSKTGALLIIAQVALTLAILGNALPIVLQRLEVSARPTGTDEANVFYTRLFGFKPDIDVPTMVADDYALIRAIPGVEAVARTNQAPLFQSGWNLSFGALREGNAEPVDVTNAAFYYTDGSLVDSLGLALIEGRDFRDDDYEQINSGLADIRPKQVMLTRAMAEKLFPDESRFVGRSVFLGSGADAQEMRVIGVVEKMQSPWAQNSEMAELSVIVPIFDLQPSAAYVVRTAPGELDRVMRDVEAALTTARDDRVHIDTRSVAEARASRYRADRALAWLLLSLTGLLVLVTASGIVGMASLWVNQRRKQIGIRRAVGARRVDILRYFLVENLMVTSAGIALGLVLAFALNHLLVQQLSIARMPLGPLGWGMLGLWLLGLLAALGPALRASRVPPAVATRTA